MSNPSSELFPAIEAILRADAGVIAAFGAKPVAIYRMPPEDAPYPFIGLPGANVTDYAPDCIDAGDVDLQIDAWSRTDPPSYDEADRIITAAQAAILAADIQLASFVVGEVMPISSRCVMERDGQTAHATSMIRVPTDPT